MTDDRAQGAMRLLEYATYALVLLAFTLGGSGGEAATRTGLLIDLAAVVVLAAWAVAHRPGMVDPAFRVATVFMLLLVFTIVIQLLPLPPGVWQALPGRASVFDVRALIGMDERWLPFSIVPARTWASGLALLPALAAFCAVAEFDGVQRHRLLILVVVLMAADLLLGVVQVSAADPAAFAIYPSVHSGRAIGFFTNRNHNATLLAIAPMLVAALVKDGTRVYRHEVHSLTIVMALVIFVVGVLTTSSRSGLVLSTITVGTTLLLLIATRPRTSRLSFRLVFAGVAALAALGVAAILLSQNMVVARVVNRFTTLFDDARFYIWTDAAFAARKFWPVGSGLGTFEAVYRTVERLETVNPLSVNHAHNEVLELLVEMGVWGAMLIVLFLLQYGLALTRVLRRTMSYVEPIAVAAAAGTLVLLIHSLTDYPLRVPALATLFAILLALLLQPRAGKLQLTEDRRRAD